MKLYRYHKLDEPFGAERDVGVRRWIIRTPGTPGNVTLIDGAEFEALPERVISDSTDWLGWWRPAWAALYNVEGLGEWKPGNVNNMLGEIDWREAYDKLEAKYQALAKECEAKDARLRAAVKLGLVRVAEVTMPSAVAQAPSITRPMLACQGDEDGDV